MQHTSSSGFILINKLPGPTSHTIINQLRRITSIKKIGHAGTLDPFASGLLLVAIGRESTKKINQFVKLDKEYIATAYLGATTNTYDREGEIQKYNYTKMPDQKEIENILKKFIGKQKQIPPMFSAKKIKGKKLYELARKGIEIKRQPSDIEIFSIEFLEYHWPMLKIKVHCSSGTYIRTLAHDIGQALGCGAYLEELERISIGKFNVKNSILLEKITDKNWQELIFS